MDRRATGYAAAHEDRTTRGAATTRPATRTPPVNRDRRRRVAVVTGASAGVGRATAVELARQGFDVGLIARGRAGLDAALADVVAAGGTGAIAVADVADMAQVDAAAEAIERELGPIEVWINNAMTTVFARIRDLTADEIRRATEVTYLGQVHGTLAALARMRTRDRGTIVFVGSALAYRGIPLQSAYCASKFAVRGFYESLRTELLEERSGIQVSIVHLPAVNTPQFEWCRARVDRHPMPVPPIYQPELIARRIVAAAQSPPRQRVVGTWNWLVIQLANAMPGVADHYMAATGVEGQLTERPIAPDRPDGLLTPADDRRDFGARGEFGDRSRGVLTPDFLRSVPAQVAALGRAIRARTAEVAARLRRPTHARPAGRGAAA